MDFGFCYSEIPTWYFSGLETMRNPCCDFQNLNTKENVKKNGQSEKKWPYRDNRTNRKWINLFSIEAECVREFFFSFLAWKSPVASLQGWCLLGFFFYLKHRKTIPEKLSLFKHSYDANFCHHGYFCRCSSFDRP